MPVPQAESVARSGRIRTMEEFAVAAGLSRPTVSKYFKDPDSVRPLTRKRIEDAMGRLGYQPNLLAVNVNRKAPKTIGMVVPSLVDPFYASLVEQVELSALEEGYWTIVLNSHGKRSMEQRAVRNLLSMRVAGAIVVPLGTTSETSALKELAETLPLVLADTRVDVDAPYIGTDNFQSVDLIVDYLLRTGEPPSYFDMPRVNRNAVERRQAYIQAMERRNAKPEVFSAPGHSWDFEAVAFDQMTKLLSRGSLPTNTVLCATDRTAFGVMAAASEHGLTVGREGQLRVAGHDDHPFSRFASPSLTTVAQDGRSMAALALKILIGRVAEQPIDIGSAHLLETQLRMRRSA